MGEQIELHRMISAPPGSRVPETARQTSIQRITSVLDGPRMRTVKRSITEFFLGKDSEEYRQKWQHRCQRLHSSRTLGAGAIKDNKDTSRPGSADLLDTTADNSVFDDVLTAASTGRKHPLPPLRAIIDPLANSGRYRWDSRSSKTSHYLGNQAIRQTSHLSTASSSRRVMRQTPSFRTRKDSVLKMAVDGLRHSMKKSSVKHKPYLRSRSFAPESFHQFDDLDSLRFDVPEYKSPTVDSVFSPYPEEILEERFFDVATPTSHFVTSPFVSVGIGDTIDGAPRLEQLPTITEQDGRLSVTDRAADAQQDTVQAAAVAKGRATLPRIYIQPRPLNVEDHKVPVTVETEEKYSLVKEQAPVKKGWRDGRYRAEPLPSTPDFLDVVDSVVEPAAFVDGIDRFSENIKHAVYDWNNSRRREIGRGFVGELFSTKYREDLTQDVQQKIEDMDEHRPFFTYWATFVQIVIYIFAVAVYGFAPLGFQETLVADLVLKPSLSMEHVSYFEKDNFWIGPRQADLIHLGAKYSPCMRADVNVIAAITADREKENQTACCVRNDGSGCLQTPKETCSPILSTWPKWSEASPGPDGRLSGSVCGQDPRFCVSPLSTGAYKWPDDITKWPVCKKSAGIGDRTMATYMSCEVIAKPCCVGIQGECIVTTREYCNFRKGYFHEEAALCSQISCMNEICGMIPFHNPDRPDQFYRLWTALFLHAGLVQLVVTVLFQFFVMRDVEKLAGWLRVCIIYIGSGIAGSLASAIFLPYSVEAGPAGAQFGIIACLFAEFFQNFVILQNPCFALLKRVILLVLLFLFGLLPYVDNSAHLFGFIYGFFLSFALLPFIGYNPKDRRFKIIGIVVCLFLSVAILVTLLILFYVSPIYDCPNCQYFNCIPFTNKFCKNMEVKIGRQDVY